MLRQGKRRERVVAGALALAIGVASGPASAADKGKPSFCASDRDIAALDARVLQTELMVAALSCGEKQRYNSFVTSYQAVLADRGQALQQMFRRAHGPAAETRLNAFITKLANDTSQQIRDKGDEYCIFAGELFDETLASSPADLNRLTNKPWIEARHGYRPCVLEAARKSTG